MPVISYDYAADDGSNSTAATPSGTVGYNSILSRCEEVHTVEHSSGQRPHAFTQGHVLRRERGPVVQPAFLILEAQEARKRPLAWSGHWQGHPQALFGETQEDSLSFLLERNIYWQDSRMDLNYEQNTYQCYRQSA